MGSGIEFFDSNVLIAALIARHPQHAAAIQCLDSIAPRLGACAAHSLAETYNTITRVSSGYGISPAETIKLLAPVESRYTLVTLTAREQVEAIASAAKQGISGPMIYDALLLTCARKIEARFIYTFNVRHFRMIAPDLAARIIEP